jgi:hypothetical protein
MGTSTVYLLLIDRIDNKLVWQKTLPVPDGLARLFPVQCLVGANRVYVLANADTSLSPPQAQTETHVISFDMRGNRVAANRICILGDRHGETSEYAYTMSEVADGIKVAGYTKDLDSNSERYATYTITMDSGLRQIGTPLVRKNGAYTYPPGARMVGDSIYLSGRFFGATVTQDDLGKFSASRLRTNGGYIWSTQTPSAERSGIHINVADDGTSYALGYQGETTTLTVVVPNGKALSPQTYRSMYCITDAIAAYADGIVAVREPCKGRGNVLVSINVMGANERRLNSIRDEPLYITTKGELWAALARAKDGKVYFYSGARGEL